MSPEVSDVHSRETLFHDGWAAGTALSEIRAREFFEAPTAVENQFILRQMGSLSGKRLLDVGAGLGEASVYFALRGADVITVDISPEMVAKACELGRLHGVEVEGRVAPGEELPVSDASCDIVYVANTIHHVTNREKLFSEIRRVLKPGGRFYSIDPIAYNPIVNIYRRMADEVRTADETPLNRSDIRLARRYFPDVSCRMFWIATLALFIKYYLVDRLHPNQDRYWKRILVEPKSALWWWRPLLTLDFVLTRIPGLRWWSWNVVMWGTKTGAALTPSV
ncbi:MAG TPA: class I SAM-dependent methyltransferase [Bryobacteraceae bacterium]|nr:class I SAM-dependent methyltransferase [Bryobacteraceae bacterium]